MTDGISFPLYFMTAMAAYGAMWGSINPGARIARDRSKGWVRAAAHHAAAGPDRDRGQGPHGLPGRVAHLGLVVPGRHVVRGAPRRGPVARDDRPAPRRSGSLSSPWASPSATCSASTPSPRQWAGSSSSSPSSAAPSASSSTRGVMLTIVKLLPSYWLVQAGKAVVGSGSWPAEGWIVVAVWTLCLIPLAVLAYRHDTGQVLSQPLPVRWENVRDDIGPATTAEAEWGAPSVSWARGWRARRPGLPPAHLSDLRGRGGQQVLARGAGAWPATRSSAAFCARLRRPHRARPRWRAVQRAGAFGLSTALLTALLVAELPFARAPASYWASTWP